MDPQTASGLWIAAFLTFVLIGALGVGFLVLRVPAQMLKLSARVSDLEHEVSLLSATAKKAARRAGIAAKKAAEPEPPPEADAPLFDTPEALRDALTTAPGPVEGAARPQTLQQLRAFLRARRGRPENGGD